MMFIQIFRLRPVTLALLPVLLSVLSGCGDRAVKRITADEAFGLSGQWNEADSRLVAREMVEDMLAQRWLVRFRNNHGRAPTVIVGDIRSLGHEPIDTDVFIADMERALANSGKVDLVTLAGEREGMRQQLYVTATRRGQEAQEVMADFVLQGAANSITDTVAGRPAHFYQLDLTLIDWRYHRKTWSGRKTIRKTADHPDDR